MEKKLPKPLQDQADAVEALYKSTPTDATAAPAPDADPTPVQEGAPASAPQEPQPVPTPPATQQPDTVAVPAPVPQPVVQQEPQAKPPEPAKDIWEQRFRTLQGMHNQNMADMKRRLGQATAENNALKERIAAMEAAPAKLDVDPKLVETYGSEMVDMVKAIVQSQQGRAPVAAPRNEALDAQVATVAQESAKTADEVFLWRVGQLVPDLEAVNADQGFLDWLALPDPIYGAPRQAALDSAAQARDVNRTAAIFDAYKRSVQPTAAVAPAPAKPSAQLEKQAAPRAGVQSQAPVQQPATAQKVTSAAVLKFYEDLRKGVYKGREAEAARMEQEFDRALAEGRISP